MPPKNLQDLLERATSKPSTKRKPATSAELARLVLPRYRDGSGEAPPPKSLLALLAIDRQFRCWSDPLVPAPKAKGPWRLPSATISATIRDVLEPFADLPETVPIWNDDPKLPALVPLPRGGDQRNFLYVTELDEDGEYPIVTFDAQPEVFLSRASLAEYVAEELASRLGENVNVAKWFRPGLSRAKKRHAKAIAKERWSDSPVLAHFLETGELPVEKAAKAKAAKPKAAKGTKTKAPGDVKALLALRKMDWWTKEYKTAVRALLADAASFAEDDLLEMVRTGPWHAGNAAAQMLVALAGGKPNAAIASMIVEIDRRRAVDQAPDRFEEGWCRNGFSHELSKPLIAILVKHPDALERIRASTQKAGVAPAYETFLTPLVKKAMKTGKASGPID